ncbi:DoxX protein [Flavobacterium sp. CF108]|uniref:DoxX family protein n=1 Tax=unclassified Flavobacterium TaxID=196869 RepID=UPI0008D39AF3|nr:MULTISPECIES: DoxX family membrane protein [unclassified Flavobacterium]SEO19633.1 DoxX protein [Flavobacterium sp. fv08]SHG53498.1 DoxX protein [Flavobacterium sp. CF108]
MKNSNGIPQLFLRIALGLGFILPVMDRIGLMGLPGSGKAAWGDWEHFINYTNTLIPFASRSVANIFGLTATLAEVIIGICLITGLKIKLAALGAALITVTFAAFMIFASGIGAPFQYPVFVFTGGALLLSTIDNFKWSLDTYINKPN